MTKAERELERGIQKRMGRILFWGMMFCTVVIVIGGVLYLNEHSGAKANFGVFVTSQNQPRSLAAVVKGIVSSNGGAIIAAGILLLVVLQYVRVALSIGMFIRLKSWFFTGISLFILGVLLYALIV
ncbi:MAG TPA: DUF1634 domain-containing protein [Spirochaetia bacterium]|nr:DUF1634 domain-containing protein [Spirochaetia bacterium]